MNREQIEIQNQFFALYSAIKPGRYRGRIPEVRKRIENLHNLWLRSVATPSSRWVRFKKWATTYRRLAA